MDPDIAHCRVCGLLYEDGALPWGAEGDSPTFDICDCCGVEFGYQDGVPDAARKYRAEWLARGAPWRWPRSRPPEWDLSDQLQQVPVKYR